MRSALIFFDCAFEYFAPTTAVRMEKSARANLVASSTSINFSPTCDAREALSQIRWQERRYGDGAQPIIRTSAQRPPRAAGGTRATSRRGAGLHARRGLAGRRPSAR